MIKRLKELRESRNLSQQELAEKLGVSQQSINKYENSKTQPDYDTLIKLADFFNTSTDYLIGNTDINHKIEPVFDYQLNSEEQVVMESFRKLDEKNKELALQLFRSLEPKVTK